MSEWISVEDRLPEFHQRGEQFVVLNKHLDTKKLATYSTVGGSHNPHEVFTSFSGETLYDVTHWILLPQLTKETE